jgi:hypothetical protein
MAEREKCPFLDGRNCYTKGYRPPKPELFDLSSYRWCLMCMLGTILLKLEDISGLMK